jgi:Fe-Mn family superoxide dismutase
MPYEVKPLACDPTAINGMSERLIVSHYENNYGGAVQRLNAITKELAELDLTSAPVFVINGLKREELIAMNSMILHEIFFASLGERGEPEGVLRDALIRDFGSVSAWTTEFSAMGKAQRGGSGWVLLTWSPRDRKLVNQGRWTTRRRWPAASRSSHSICTSTPITSTMAPRRPPMSTRSWRRSIGRASPKPTLGSRP